MTFSRRVLISSIPRLEAPSISITSRLRPAEISRHAGHLPQGAAVGPSWQLSARARILAQEVFPTPARPGKKIGVGKAVLLDGAL